VARRATRAWLEASQLRREIATAAEQRQARVGERRGGALLLDVLLGGADPSGRQLELGAELVQLGRPIDDEVGRVVAAAELPDAPRHGLQAAHDRSADQHHRAKRDHRHDHTAKRDQQPAEALRVMTRLAHRQLRIARPHRAGDRPRETDDPIGRGDAIDGDERRTTVVDDLGERCVSAMQQRSQPRVGQGAPIVARLGIRHHQAIGVGDEQRLQLGVERSPRGQPSLQRTPVIVGIGVGGPLRELAGERAQAHAQLGARQIADLGLEARVEARGAGAEHEPHHRGPEHDEGQHTAGQPPHQARARRRLGDRPRGRLRARRRGRASPAIRRPAGTNPIHALRR
jgi:hypothetical protein